MFDLEQTIKKWKKTMQKSQAIQDGDLTELESYLRDKIEDLVGRGTSEEEAFQKAESEFARAESLDGDYYRAQTRKLGGRPPWQSPGLTPALVWNYAKIAFRKIKRQRAYSFINIAGLAIGLAVCILILLFVKDELSYDRYHVFKDRIYRIERHFLAADGSVRLQFCSLAPAFAINLKQEFPEIERIVRVLSGANTQVRIGDKTFLEDRFFYAEDGLLEILSIPLLQGEPKTALSDPNTIILSETTARKYFANDNPLGRELNTGGKSLFKVTGVMRDTPANSHVHFDLIASYNTLKGAYIQNGDDYFLGTRNFSDNVTYTYLRLAEKADPKNLAARFPAFLDRLLGTRTDDQGNVIKASQSNRLWLRRVTDIHLTSHTSNELEPNGDQKYVTMFSFIALFVLVIACINFVNLATARASRRAREVGLRKVVGAHRKMLTWQFLMESLIISLASLFLALVVASILLPFFKVVSGRALEISSLFRAGSLLMLGGLWLFTALASGLYPAVYLAAFRPAPILRGELTQGRGGALLRRVLVVFQFAISIILIIAVGIVFRQMNYLKNADLGFDRENILLLPADRTVGANWRGLKERILSSPYILSATLSKRAPSGRLLDAPGFWAEVNGQKMNSPFSMPHNRVDYDFFKTYGMKIIAGRDFSLDYPTDAGEAYIINETAARLLGWTQPEDAVGKPMGVSGAGRPNAGRIIGVVADFNYESMHYKIRPMVTYIRPIEANTIAVRIAAGNPRNGLDHIRAVWEKEKPDYPFQYDFMDDRLNALYRNEERMMKMFAAFSALAIFIACLGLSGLASFMAEQRTREVGIRKVLGASPAGITVMFSKEFARWVLTANLLALPAAYLVMDKWLKNFAYRVRMDIWVFAAASALTLVIALVTVSAQSLRSALANPAESLKHE